MNNKQIAESVTEIHKGKLPIKGDRVKSNIFLALLRDNPNPEIIEAVADIRESIEAAWAALIPGDAMKYYDGDRPEDAPTDFKMDWIRNNEFSAAVNNLFDYLS